MQELLKHFHQLSLHPKNAKELKGLILQLAIQGKLTADWRLRHPELVSGSNSGENLLENIKVEKAKLVKKKEIKKEKALPIITEDEFPFGLPKAWTWCRLVDVTEYIQRGKSPKYSEVPKIPVVSQKCVQWSGFDISRARFITEESLEKYQDERFLIEGDLLWNSTGNGTIGRTILLPKLKYDQIVADSHVTVVRPFRRSLLSEYLWIYSASPLVQKTIEGRVSGSTKQTELGTSTVKALEFALPPLEEQKVIVKTVETLFKEVEALENLTEKRIELKKVYATSALSQLAKNDSKKEWQTLKPQFQEFFNEVDNIKKLRETILQLAFQGKLTAKWRAKNPELILGENSAANLLKEIKAEKAKLIKAKAFQKPRQKGEIKKGEFKYNIPKTWVNAKIVDLAFVTKLAGFEYTKYIKLKDNGAVPVIRAQNVKMNRIDERKLKYIDLETSEQLYRCALDKPSVLMTFIGAGIGDVAVFDKKERWHLAPNVAKLEPFNKSREKLNIYYLLFYLMSPIGQSQIFKHSKATAQPSLSMGTIRDSIVLLPSVEEQNIIVQKVNSLMDLCVQLEKEIKTGQQQMEDLMQSVLKEVFEGENKINEVSVI